MPDAARDELATRAGQRPDSSGAAVVKTLPRPLEPALTSWPPFPGVWYLVILRDAKRLTARFAGHGALRRLRRGGASCTAWLRAQR
jgi:hypothetical protein